MPLIDLPTAKAHLRLESDYPDEQVTPYLAAAELRAAEFLNRRVYASQGELDAAVAAVPAALTTASEAHAAAIEVADAIDDQVARRAARDYADLAYLQAQAVAVETRAGIVVNAAITAGVLLILGHLFENRQDVQAGVTVVQVPMGSQYLLMPYRVGLGA